MYPLSSAPVLASTGTDLVKYLQPVPGKPQTFVAPELISPAKYKKLKLIPFYKLHDVRYMIYWHQGVLKDSGN